MINDAIIIQQVYSRSDYANMLRLSSPRHLDYALRHKMDYQCLMSDVLRDHPHAPWKNGFPSPNGAWTKIVLIRDALAIGYEYVIWIDADALIYDMKADLRDAYKEFEHIGACQHPGPPVHLNVGVAFYRNTEPTKTFINTWFGSYGRTDLGQWLEQGVFNRLMQETGTVKRISDKWNATEMAGTNVPDAIIKGYHGPGNYTPLMRFQAMQADLAKVV